jgi:hypothetical protein
MQITVVYLVKFEQNLWKVHGPVKKNLLMVLQKPEFLTKWYDWKSELQDKFQGKLPTPDSNKMYELVHGYKRNAFIILLYVN